MRSSLMMMSVVALLSGCAAPKRPSGDSAYAEVQRRGATVMGVDQYTSQHVFESLPDGGRIMLERDDAGDTAAIRTIRAHMRDVATDFRDGNFTKPFQVHAMEVPGTAAMSRLRGAITYTIEDLPRGAQVRLTTSDSAAVTAIHEFLAFQRTDHRAAGHTDH